MMIKKQISRIKELIEAFVKNSYELPEKSDKVLFNDTWLSQLETEDDYVKLFHFGKEELEYLDPSHFGKNSYTDSEKWWGRDRLFFYTNLEQKERIISGVLYTANVNLKDLYPFNSDPLNLYEIAVQMYGNENVPYQRQVLYISNMLIDMGYKGMIYKWHDGTLLAVIWEKVTDIKSKQGKKEYKLPTSDLNGWSIENGISTDDRLSDEEKINRVVKTMERSNYPQAFIDNYLDLMSGR